MNYVNRPRNFDPRSTVRVEETRSTRNGKPFRTKAQKVEASRYAVRINGAFCCKAPVSFHGDVSKKD
ncbi:hypothetical protein ABIB07_003510 [Bradyrhizobium sp. RT10b]